MRLYLKSIIYAAIYVDSRNTNIERFKYFKFVISVVNKGDNLGKKRKHTATLKSVKTVKRNKANPAAVAKAKRGKKPRITAGKKTRDRLPLRNKNLPQKKAIVEEAIRKIYSEKERLEMQRIYSVLSEPYARQLLIDLAGENALEIVRNFYGSLSDEELAKKLKLKISDVRATLNKLHSEGLVNYLRDKDNETGWYSYSWALNRDRIKRWVETKIREKTDLVNGNSGDHYFCPSCGPSSIVGFEAASDTSFKCSKCNKDLDFLDDGKIAALVDSRLYKTR